MTENPRRLVSGAVGALVLTVIHESARRLRSDAPRMDVVGMRVLERGFAEAGEAPPPREQLFAMTLAGDLISNTAYYAMVPADNRRETWMRAVGLGVAAGLGAYTLPKEIGVGDPPNSQFASNAVMTVAWYLAGALAAAACANLMRQRYDPALP